MYIIYIINYNFNQIDNVAPYIVSISILAQKYRRFQLMSA